MNSVGFGDSNHKTIPYTRDGPVDKTSFCGGALRGGSNEGGGGAAGPEEARWVTRREAEYVRCSWWLMTDR